MVNGRRTLRRVVRVEPVRDLIVRFKFDDGMQKVIDVDWYLRGPVFEEIRRDPQLFHAMKVDDELGSVVWPNGADLDTQVLYHDDLYPSEWDEEGLSKEEAVARKRSTLVDLAEI